MCIVIAVTIYFKMKWLENGRKHLAGSEFLPKIYTFPYSVHVFHVPYSQIVLLQWEYEKAAHIPFSVELYVLINVQINPWLGHIINISYIAPAPGEPQRSGTLDILGIN